MFDPNVMSQLESVTGKIFIIVQNVEAGDLVDFRFRSSSIFYLVGDDRSDFGAVYYDHEPRSCQLGTGRYNCSTARKKGHDLISFPASYPMSFLIRRNWDVKITAYTICSLKSL